MVVTVNTQLYASSANADSIVTAVVDAIPAQPGSWRVTSFAADPNAGGLLPHWIPVRFVVDGVGTEDNAKAAISAAIKDKTGFFASWGDLVSSASSDVVVATGRQVAGVVADVAHTAEKAAGGIGLGVGVAVGGLAVIAVITLVFIYAPRGA